MIFIELLCPYCKNELIKGFVGGSRFFLKWHKEDMGFLEKNTIFGGEILGDGNFIKYYRCLSCNKIIIDLDKL